MIALDISDTSLESAKLYKPLIGKPVLKNFQRLEFNQDEVWINKLPQFIKGNDVSLAICDRFVYLMRFTVKNGLSDGALQAIISDKMGQTIPYKATELIYDYKIVPTLDNPAFSEIILIASARELIKKYSNALNTIGIQPRILIPESMAIFEVIKEYIKNATVLYIDIGSKEAEISFFDGFGPIMTFSETVRTDLLGMETRKVIDFFQRKNPDEKIEGVILGGGGSITQDPQAFSKDLGIRVVNSERILSGLLQRKDISLLLENNTPGILFLNTIGLALYSMQKNILNLAK